MPADKNRASSCKSGFYVFLVPGRLSARYKNRASSWKIGINVLLVPGLSAAGECQPTRTEQAVGIYVHCSRETERSGGVSPGKNRASSWKSGFNVFLVPGRTNAAGECLPTRTEQAVGRPASMCSLFQGD